MPENIVLSFIESYKKEYHYYNNLSSLVSTSLSNQLKEAGIRSIVTFRAKSIDSLQEKLLKRNKQKAYTSKQEINEDIVDLAGVRVAIYFPGDIDAVSNIINENYDIIKEKRFPDTTKNNSNEEIYKKKFDGYHALHFRIKVKHNKEFQDEAVEIQVASVLMHAWSEVEHDLVYKPLQGLIPKEELMILDEINGMVISGNIALERLQTSINERINSEGFIFENHYDLASFISKEIGTSEIFKAKGIFDLFNKLGIKTKDKISPIIKNAKKRYEDRESGRNEPYYAGVLLGCIIASVMDESAEKFKSLLLSGFKPLNSEKIKQDLIILILSKENKKCATALSMLEKINVKSRSFDEADTFNLNNYDIFFEPKKEEVSDEEAKNAMFELIEIINKMVLDDFNSQAYKQAITLSENVADTIKYKEESSSPEKGKL
ncbi:GTP pyrophosphokinase [Serratia marcescens]|uniref:GTP pyrophosphokinase n=1 Tax=Serratia marcescens TaxID=615 RepID=UPI0032EF6AFC